MHDNRSEPRSDSTESAPTPNDLGEPGEPIEIPNAVAVDIPPDDFNIDGVLQELGDFAIDFSVDMVLSDLPMGFDTSTGTGVPGVRVPGEEDNGDGGGSNPFG